MKKLAIFGAGTMSNSYIDIIENINEYEIVGLIDDRYPELKNCNGFPVLGQSKDIKEICETNHISDIVICIGDNNTRAIIADKIKTLVKDINFPIIIDPEAYVSKRATLNEGCVIRGSAYIDAGVILGKFCLVGLSSILPHNSVMSDFSSFSAGVTVGGEFKLGKFSYMGIGSCASHCIEIGEETVIGAGSVVTRNIPSFSVAYGIPAKVQRSRIKGEKYL